MSNERAMTMTPLVVSGASARICRGGDEKQTWGLTSESALVVSTGSRFAYGDLAGLSNQPSKNQQHQAASRPIHGAPPQ